MATVEFYYSDTCHNCHQVRALLLSVLPKNTKFKEINVSYPEGKQRALELNIMSVPVVVVNGDIAFIGRVSREEIIEKLNLGK